MRGQVYTWYKESFSDLELFYFRAFDCLATVFNGKNKEFISLSEIILHFHCVGQVLNKEIEDITWYGHANFNSDELAKQTIERDDLRENIKVILNFLSRHVTFCSSRRNRWNSHHKIVYLRIVIDLKEKIGIFMRWR